MPKTQFLRSLKKTEGFFKKTYKTYFPLSSFTWKSYQMRDQMNQSSQGFPRFLPCDMELTSSQPLSKCSAFLLPSKKSGTHRIILMMLKGKKMLTSGEIQMFRVRAILIDKHNDSLE